MSIKAIAAFMLAFFLLTTISYLAEGGGGFSVTRLEQSLASTGTIAYVDSTAGYEHAGTIKIAEEEIYYNGITPTAFLNLDRGENDTDANSYSSRTKIYSDNAATMNNAMGSDFAEMASNSGWLGIFMIPKVFFVDVVPSLIMWDFSILKDEAPMQMFRMVLFCFSVGFILYVIYIVFQMLGGVAQSIIGRFGL